VTARHGRLTRHGRPRRQCTRRFSDHGRSRTLPAQPVSESGGLLPGANIWDTRLSKLTPLRENVNLRFLAEFFNTWNHAAFGNPNSNLDTATFGTINSTLSNARIIQLGLKLEF
jgi:hypothetical protein